MNGSELVVFETLLIVVCTLPLGKAAVLWGLVELSGNEEHPFTHVDR